MLIETDGLTKAVRNLLGDPTTEILKTKKQVLGDGLADAIMGGEGLQLCSGVAQTKAGDREFEIVTKTSLNYPDGASLDSWLYWKREALAYNSGWLDSIPAGLRAPRCFGVEFIDDSTAVIYMEAVKNAETEWTMDTYAMAGQALGRFSGSYLDKSGLIFDSWMAPGRAFSWVDASRETLDNLTDLKNDPILSRWLSGSNFKRTVELLDQVENLRAALSELPMGLCHHDALRGSRGSCQGIFLRDSGDLSPGGAVNGSGVG